MSNESLQKKLHTCIQNRLLTIRKFYPKLIFIRADIFTLNYTFECEQVKTVTESIRDKTSFFIINIRAYIPNRYFRNNMPLSDYQSFNSDLEEDDVSLPCGNWYASAHFKGEDVNHHLHFSIQDTEGKVFEIATHENFHFTEAFNHFYLGITDFSTKYKTLKLWKSNKNYDADLLRLKTGFISRENALTRKFHAENEKYYRNTLGIGRKK